MKNKDIITYFVIFLTILFLVLPMNLSPFWNSSGELYKDQYEKMTDSIIQGKIYLDYDLADDLSSLDNPYSPEEREEKGVQYLWDHAYYNGHYYMYFGIAPVILVFLPFRLITGYNIATLHVTQLFVAFFVIGLFVLFKKFLKLFFKDVPIYIYLILSVSFSIISVWYIISAPVLYCTAISAGLCMAIWSLIFLITSLYECEENERKEIIYLALASLFGAIVFACRPPIALFNIIFIPAIIILLKKKKINLKRILKLILALSPYIIIGILLMSYNNARFENPFEFGQSYQLTIADQHKYGIFNNFNLLNTLKGFVYLNFNILNVNAIYRGIFITFPILFFSIFVFLMKSKKENNIGKSIIWIILTLFLINFLICLFDTTCSPILVPRYRMDILWTMSISSYLAIGCIHNKITNKKLFHIILITISIISIIIGIYLFFIPFDSNFASIYLSAN